MGGIWPDYGTPGAPSMDPYYMSAKDEAAMIAREDAADSIAATQAASTAAFLTARQAFVSAICMLDFPLGSPVVGYDLEDITATLDDWSKVEAPNEDAAMDAARDAA